MSSYRLTDASPIPGMDYTMYHSIAWILDNFNVSSTNSDNWIHVRDIELPRVFEDKEYLAVQIAVEFLIDGIPKYVSTYLNATKALDGLVTEYQSISSEENYVSVHNYFTDEYFEFAFPDIHERRIAMDYFHGEVIDRLI